ncbi:uncharacterized protein LOC121733292, partial [Aricia agestis]|uniref:uncharacterized protein LOC121733292 n=1 Tax=Aricia agestis TaxID=91739 RepID=UPI001C2078EB
YEPDSSEPLDFSVRGAVLAIDAGCGFYATNTGRKRRKDLEMVPRKPIAVYNIEDDIDRPPAELARRPRAHRVAPADCEVEERCELIKSTYEVISKYTRAMFDKQNETVV